MAADERKVAPTTKTRFEAVNFYNEGGKGDGRSAAASAVLQQGCVTDRPGRCQILWRLNFIKNSVNATSWAVQCPAAGAGALIGQARAAAVARWRDKKAKDCDQTPSSHSHTWPGQAGDSTYITHVT